MRIRNWKVQRNYEKKKFTKECKKRWDGMEVLPEKDHIKVSVQINPLFEYNFNNLDRVILEIENKGRQDVISVWGSVDNT